MQYTISAVCGKYGFHNYFTQWLSSNNAECAIIPLKDLHIHWTFYPYTQKPIKKALPSKPAQH